MASIPLTKNIPRLFGPTENLKKSADSWEKAISFETEFQCLSYTLKILFYLDQLVFDSKNMFCPKNPNRKGT